MKPTRLRNNPLVNLHLKLKNTVLYTNPKDLLRI